MFGALVVVMAAAVVGNAQAGAIDVEGQPLAANVRRLLEALEFLGAPLPAKEVAAVSRAVNDQDAAAIQRLLDSHVLVEVGINPERRVRAKRGGAGVTLQQAAYVPVIIKVVNDASITGTLSLSSPQAGPVYAGVGSLQRQEQTQLMANQNVTRALDRFLDLELYGAPPMTPVLSGLRVEYVLALLYSSEAGRREATLGFDVGQGTQDLGFRAEVPILFKVLPAIPVKLSVKDENGRPTTARFTFLDGAGHVYPSQAKRLAPDLFFQKHIYRADGETVLLPPKTFTMIYGRGPEYRTVTRAVTIAPKGKAAIAVAVERWVNPGDHGFVSGDPHIHAAGCAHYSSPTEGVFARDVFAQLKGEALNVGSILTWGPCWGFQRQFFEAKVHRLSEPSTVMKYDVEVSGFGSQAMGHVALLNLKEIAYPGSQGTTGWPTWTGPVLEWAKKQGAFTGYPHPAEHSQPAAAAKRIFEAHDGNKDAALTAAEAQAAFLPDDFGKIDRDADGRVSENELVDAMNRAVDQLPNFVVPEMDGGGAQENIVTAAVGLTDFRAGMDTPRIGEWNTWYHMMNAGVPLKISGETDFPCMSGTRVGQGRTYVRVAKPGQTIARVDYAAWTEGLAKGRSYVSDGFAHALEFQVNGKRSAEDLTLEHPDTVEVKATVAFGSQTPVGSAYGGVMPAAGNRSTGDTRTGREAVEGLDKPPPAPDTTRLVELVVNGRAVAAQKIVADDRAHDIVFRVRIDRSSWVALRHFPQMHTNPVNVLIAGKPIRASRRSALWCAATVDQLWRRSSKWIADAEKDAARKTYDRAIERYRAAAAEASE